MKTTKTLDQFITEQHGEIGTEKCDNLEKGYESFKLATLKIT